MENSFDDKLERLNLLLQGDEDLENLDTQLSTKMKAKSSARSKQDEKLQNRDKTESTVDESSGWTTYSPNLNDLMQAYNARKSQNTNPNDQFLATINIPLAYCPALALMRLPYKFFAEEESRQKSLEKFFDPSNLWDRTWTLHYLELPPGCHRRLLLLVPLQEVIDFLQEVNTALSCEMAITDVHEGFVLEFDEPDCPKPKLLGVSTTSATKQKLVIDKSFQITGSWGDWSRSYEPTVLRNLEKKIGAGLDAEKHLRSKGKKKKRLNPLEHARAWAERMDRVQQYMGLRPKDAGIATYVAPVNVNRAAPWPYPDEPVFFSLDVEWKEKNPAHVTEVGISILDTRDLVGPPGLHGANWVAKIRSYHLRVSEYSHWVNKEFCQGCPDRFNFGTSEFVEVDKIGKRVDDFFAPPYDGSRTDKPGQSTTTRPLIYVGHDYKQDLEQLAVIKSQVFRKILFNGTQAIFEDVLDTAQIYRGLRNDVNLSSLSATMTGLNVWTRDLHNAGNDARYSLVALVIMALEAAGEHDAAVAQEPNL